MKRKPPASPYELQRKAAQRVALNALKRARRSAEKAGVSLSEWEDEFLTSVSERVKEHGRAFGDPELGGPGQALSAMQGRKLKEIAKKANGEDRFSPKNKANGKDRFSPKNKANGEDRFSPKNKANGEDRAAPQRKRGARTPYPSRDINDE
ncbi:hypothetical protein [Brevundimonas sp.]|uniref:hypothetical protein n=1 Tax=Brevundimonas sp. TaxID=1871086 RepID=UPI00289C0067|nr:hypothetical protein [Brevundimonas sp.]